MSKSNRLVYETQDIVQLYSREIQLQKAEESIFNILKNKLNNMKMLDIGVGGGRTSIHFANCVKEYIGIDYSRNMIKVCEENFPERGKNILFKVADVRDLHLFENDYFDFILFSYNGLDYISYKDRSQALTEIKRVGKLGGYFCFSTHNIQYINYMLTVPFCKSPIRLAFYVFRYFHVKSLIKREIRGESVTHAIIRDGGEEFRARTCYVNPEKQIDQLKYLGFRDIRIFSERNGKELKGFNKLNTIKDDRWLYYLCRC